MKKEIDALEWENLSDDEKSKWIGKVFEQQYEKMGEIFKKVKKSNAAKPTVDAKEMIKQSNQAIKSHYEPAAKDLFYKEHKNKSYFISQYLYSKQVVKNYATI